MDIVTYYRLTATVITALIGLCIGSFLNVVIYRLPNNMSLSFPASHCPKCNYELKWYDNIPILSYLMLGGKCRSCKERISPRYITVELLNCILWLLCLSVFGYKDVMSVVTALCAAAACSVCICVALIDFEHKIIFDRFHIILIILGIVFTLFESSFSFKAVAFNILTGLVCFGLFWILGFIVEKMKNVEAMGGGDMKFVFSAGIFLGASRSLLLLLIASVTASIFILVSRLKSGEENEEDRQYPFGPFLSFGFVTALLFGEIIINNYMNLFGME